MKCICLLFLNCWNHWNISLKKLELMLLEIMGAWTLWFETLTCLFFIRNFEVLDISIFEFLEIPPKTCFWKLLFPPNQEILNTSETCIKTAFWSIQKPSFKPNLKYQKHRNQKNNNNFETSNNLKTPKTIQTSNIRRCHSSSSFGDPPTIPPRAHRAHPRPRPPHSYPQMRGVT